MQSLACLSKQLMLTEQMQQMMMLR